jgi:chromosome segregation ATPase
MSDNDIKPGHLKALIGQYWSIAYAEGSEKRTTDTPAGDAQRVWHEIESTIDRLTTQLKHYQMAATAEANLADERHKEIKRLRAERDAAVADAASLRERMLALEAQRDEFSSREWQAEKDKRQAETERDEAQRKLSVAVANGNALVAEAERYRAVIVYALAQHNYGGHPLQNHWAAHAQNELAAIDAARAEGRV